MPWATLLAFLRLATNPRILPKPLTGPQAIAQMEAWLALRNVWTPMPTEAHADMLAKLVKEANAAGDLIPDAHLAALAIEHSLTLCSADRDFARFAGLRWINPLTA